MIILPKAIKGKSPETLQKKKLHIHTSYGHIHQASNKEGHLFNEILNRNFGQTELNQTTAVML